MDKTLYGHDNLEFARGINSLQYLLSGSHISIKNAIKSDAGKKLFEIIDERFRDTVQANRFFSFYNVENKTSELISKAFQNFERVFSANDKKFKILDLKDVKTLDKVKKVISEFESIALHELRQNITIYLVIYKDNDDYKLLFLPADYNFSIKYNKNKEIIGYYYSDTVEVTADFVKIGEKEYKNTLSILPATRLISKEVKPFVSWSPTFGYLGVLRQILIDTISIEWQKLSDQHPIAVTASYSCNYIDAEGNKCESGNIRYFIEGNNKPQYKKCPSCGLGVGPGQQIEVKGVIGSDKAPDLDSAYKKVNTDIAPLKEARSALERDVVNVYESITGLKYSLGDKSSYENEKHLIADKEKAETIFNTLAKELTKVEKWITNFVTLSENNEIFSTEIDLGSDFYLLTKTDILNDLKISKESGAPMFMISDSLEQLNNLQNKEIAKREEFTIWSALEPFVGMSLSEIENVASEKDKFIKANFITLISEIKLELQTDSFIDFFNNTNLTKFDGINLIKNLLNTKYNENTINREARID